MRSNETSEKSTSSEPANYLGKKTRRLRNGKGTRTLILRKKKITTSPISTEEGTGVRGREEKITRQGEKQDRKVKQYSTAAGKKLQLEDTTTQEEKTPGRPENLMTERRPKQIE